MMTSSTVSSETVASASTASLTMPPAMLAKSEILTGSCSNSASRSAVALASAVALWVKDGSLSIKPWDFFREICFNKPQTLI